MIVAHVAPDGAASIPPSPPLPPDPLLDPLLLPLLDPPKPPLLLLELLLLELKPLLDPLLLLLLLDALKPPELLDPGPAARTAFNGSPGSAAQATPRDVKAIKEANVCDALRRMEKGLPRRRREA